MIKKKKELIETKVIESITCNYCGKESQCLNGSYDESLFTHVCHYGGYFSSFPEDGIVLSFDLCEDCLKKIVSQLVIPADIEEERY